MALRASSSESSSARYLTSAMNCSSFMRSLLSRRARRLRCTPPGPLLPRWWLLPRRPLLAGRESGVGRYFGPRSRREISRWHAWLDLGSGRNTSRRGTELWRGFQDAEQLLRPLGQLRLHYLCLPEEGGHVLFTGNLGVRGVAVAVLGTLQGVIEDAYQIVVLVSRSRGLLSVIHLSS